LFDLSLELLSLGDFESILSQGPLLLVNLSKFAFSLPLVTPLEAVSKALSVPSAFHLPSSLSPVYSASLPGTPLFILPITPLLLTVVISASFHVGGHGKNVHVLTKMHDDEKEKKKEEITDRAYVPPPLMYPPRRFDPFVGIRGAASVAGGPPVESETRRIASLNLIENGGNLHMSEDVSYKISFFDSLKMGIVDSGIIVPHGYIPVCVCGLPTLHFDFKVSQSYGGGGTMDVEETEGGGASPVYSYTSDGYVVGQFAVGYLIELDPEDEYQPELNYTKDRNFFWGSDARYALLRQNEEVYGRWSVLVSGEHGGGLKLKKQPSRKKGRRVKK
jgi:hypothetical protein